MWKRLNIYDGIVSLNFLLSPFRWCEPVAGTKIELQQCPSEIMDINALTEGKIIPGKAGLNLGMGVAGFSRVLAPLSITYFGSDAYYPGGINGAIETGTKVYQDNPTYYPQFSY